MLPRRNGVAPIAALILAATLSACQQPPAKPTHTVSAPAPDDPVLAFVTTAKSGQSAVVADRTLGQVRVTFIEEYPAASGEICRRYALQTAQGQKTGAACYNGTSWELAPLIP
jgi:hypothetical protein